MQWATTLLGRGMVKEAIQIFEFAVAAFPESSNIYDSLGEALMADKQNEHALNNYRKSVDLKGENTFLKMALIPPVDYLPTKIPNDTTDLFFSLGNFSKDTAYIFAQGGPLPELETNDYDALMLLPNADDKLRIYPRQSQMINPTLLASEPVLNPSQSAFEHLQSAEMLHRTISFLKERGKVVYVIGHSYGAMISLEYLNSFENKADKIVLMGMNLDADLRNYEQGKPGELVRWEKGIDPYFKPLFPDNQFPMKSLIKDDLDRVFANTDNLVESSGRKRFTQLLENKDLSNIIFVHGKYDESIGRVKAYELDFLQSKGAKTLEVLGDHHSMFNRDIMQDVYRLILDLENTPK